MAVLMSRRSVCSSPRANGRMSLWLTSTFVRVMNLANWAGIGGCSAQRCAEILLEEARSHLDTSTTLEEVRFVLLGEPTYRIFEMTKDAAAVQRQMEALCSR